MLGAGSNPCAEHTGIHGEMVASKASSVESQEKEAKENTERGIFMIREYFLRKRAFQVGQNTRQMHDDAGVQKYVGEQLVELAAEQWKDYCRSVSPPRHFSYIQEKTVLSAKEQKLLTNDSLRATYFKAFIQGYQAKDTPKNREQE